LLPWEPPRSPLYGCALRCCRGLRHWVEVGPGWCAPQVCCALQVLALRSPGDESWRVRCGLQVCCAPQVPAPID
jgi:hypothetical protein